MGLRRRVPGARAIALAATMVVLTLALPAGAGATTRAGLAPAPGISPPGANDWSCRPTARRPVPVILVHGTFGDMTVSLERARARCSRRTGSASSPSTTATARPRRWTQSGRPARRLRAPGAVRDRRRQGLLRRALPGRLARAATSCATAGCWRRTRRRRRPRALQPRHDEPARRARPGVLVCPACLRPAGRLGRACSTLNAPPEAPRAGRLDRGLDALRRGRARPTARRPWRVDHVTNVVLQDRCPARPHRPPRDHLRPRRRCSGRSTRCAAPGRRTRPSAPPAS